MKLTKMFRYAGSKDAKRYRVLLKPDQQTVVCTPFLGAMSTNLAYPDTSQYGADISPYVRYMANLGNDSNRCEVFKKWLVMMRDDLDAKPHSEQLMSVDYMKAVYHNAQLSSELNSYQAANQCILTYLLFRSILRHNKNDGLNVSPCHTRVANIGKWDVEGYVDAIQNQKLNLHVSSNWDAAINSVPEPEISNTYLEIDPPYFTHPEIRMTPCYPNHDVHNSDLTRKPLELGTSKGFPKITVCGYDSPIMDEIISGSCQGYEVTKHVIENGCKGIGNGLGDPGRKERRVNVEVIWVLERQ
jgi:hypothetical protein